MGGRYLGKVFIGTHCCAENCAVMIFDKHSIIIILKPKILTDLIKQTENTRWSKSIHFHFQCIHFQFFYYHGSLPNKQDEYESDL